MGSKQWPHYTDYVMGYNDRVADFQSRSNRVYQIPEGLFYDENGFRVDAEGRALCYVDGSVIQDSKSGFPDCGGYGVYWDWGHPANDAQPLEQNERIVSSVAEAGAIKRCFEIARIWGLKKLTIVCDNESLVEIMTSLSFDWLQNGWRRKTRKRVRGKEEYIELITGMDGLDVNWVWVNSHIGIVGNEGADTLARKGSQLFRAQQCKDLGVPYVGPETRHPSVCPHPGQRRRTISGSTHQPSVYPPSDKRRRTASGVTNQPPVGPPPNKRSRTTSVVSLQPSSVGPNLGKRRRTTSVITNQPSIGTPQGKRRRTVSGANNQPSDGPLLGKHSRTATGVNNQPYVGLTPSKRRRTASVTTNQPSVGPLLGKRKRRRTVSGTTHQPSTGPPSRQSKT